MRKFAMVLLDQVIDVIENDYPPKYPPDQEGNEVLTIGCDDTVQVGDIMENGILIGTKIPQPTQLDQIQSMIDYLAMMIGE